MNLIIILLLVFMFFLFAIIAVLIFASRVNNITLHFKEPVNNNFLYHKRKARLTQDNEGQEFYKSTKKINGKRFFPIPESSESVHIDNKGKKHIFGYISAHGDVVYSLDKNTQIFTDEKLLKEIQPLTTNQRALYINQERKAREDAGFNWKQQMPLIVSGFVLIVILVLSMIIFRNLYQDNAELQKINRDITNKQGQILDKYVEIETGIQEIKQEIRSNNNNSISGVIP